MRQQDGRRFVFLGLLVLGLCLWFSGCGTMTENLSMEFLDKIF